MGSHTPAAGTFARMERVAVAANIATVAVLVNSTLRFAWGASGAHARQRLAGAVSSLLTLALACAIYSGEFKRNVLGAAAGSSSGVARAAVRFATAADGVCTRLANVLNPARDVSYRPSPSLWPFALLVAAFAVRWLIYLFISRPGRGQRYAGVTGSVYWSHFSAYLLTVAFLAMVAHWDARAVGVASVVLLLLVLLGAVFAEDLWLVIGTGLVAGANLASAGAKAVAEGAVIAASAARALIESASRWYLAHVRGPLRKSTAHVVEATEQVNTRMDERLISQERAHRERFGRTDDSGGAPNPGKRVVQVAIACVLLATLVGAGLAIGRSGRATRSSPTNAAQTTTAPITASPTTPSTSRMPVWLMDLPAISGRPAQVGNAGVGPVTYDHSIVSLQGGVDGGEVTYDLGGRYKRFQAVIGLRNDSAAGIQFRFDVLGDGRSLKSGGVGASQIVEVDVDVSAVRTLTLREHEVSGRADHWIVFGRARLLS